MTQPSTKTLEAFTMPATDALLRELAEAWGYKPMQLSDEAKREIGRNLARFMGREKDYSREYVANILAGRTDSRHIREAIIKLLIIASGEARPEQVQGQAVEVIALGHVHPGSLILMDSRLCACGLWFVPRAWNQVDHCQAGKRIRRQIRKI